MTIRLYSYWRSSAAYRVRIVLALKGLDYETVPVSLAPGVSEHRTDAYRARNPQMLVPFLEDGAIATGQSQAIMEYLEEAYPEPPLLPKSRRERAEVRAFCNGICCDIHPLNNLRVLQYLKNDLGADEAAISAWYSHWIRVGFRAAETMAERHAAGGPFVFGATPTLADACLVPQMYNARRYAVTVDDFPRLVAVVAHCNTLPAFLTALPENQPDAA